MGNRYSIGIFKQNQMKNSAKYLAKKEFNVLMDNLISEVVDEITDFALSLYDKIGSLEVDENGVLLIDKILHDIDDVLTIELTEKFKGYIDNYDFSKSLSSDFSRDLVFIGMSTYLTNVYQYCTDLCSTYLDYLVVPRIQELFKEECCCILSSLDKGFLTKSGHRLSSIFRKLKDNFSYLHDEFSDVCLYTLYNRYEDMLVDKISEVSSDVLYSKDFSDEFLDLIFDYLRGSLGELDIEDTCIEEDDLGKLNYISDYKKLNKLAVDNGFEFVRCKGDHGIYKSESGIVVIPQGRTVGKGLSIKIQKAIYSLRN